MKTIVSIVLAFTASTPGLADEVVLDPGRHPTPGVTARAAPDGKAVVTLGSDRCFRVWDVATGKQLRTLWLPEGAGSMHERRFWLSPDGKLVALPFYTKEKRLAKFAFIPLAGPDCGTFQVVDGNVSEVDHLAFSPDGTRVATACERPPVIVWDVATGKKVCDIDHNKNLSASGLAFTPNGKALTVALPLVNTDGDRTSAVVTYDATTGKPTSRFSLNGTRTRVSFRPLYSPDGKTLVLHYYDKLELRAPDGTLRTTIRGRRLGLIPRAPQVVAFDKKGRLLSAQRGSDSWVVRDETAGKVLRRLKSSSDESSQVSYTAGRHALLIKDNQVTLFALAAGGPKPVSIRVANRVATALGWAKGPTLGWGFGPLRTGRDGRLEHAVNLARLKPVKVGSTKFTRRRHEWGDVKLTVTGNGYQATAKAGGRTVKLKYYSELDSDDIDSATLVGPGHAVLSTDRGLFGYDTKTGKSTTSYKPSSGWLLAPSPDGRIFAAATGGTPLIHIYRRKRSEPALTVYAVGRKWVAWTPDGAWASSPGAEAWAGTLTSPGAGRLPTFVPFDPKSRAAAKVKSALK
jgi:WD40 repeat protein